MGRSKIIKDFINNKNSIFQTLEVLNILLQELNDTQLLKWVTNELQGYENEKEVPQYRVITGCVKADLANSAVMMYNRPIPVNNFNNEFKINLNTLSFKESIKAIEYIVDTEQQSMQYRIPPEFYPHLEKSINLHIQNAVTEYSLLEFQNIIAKLRVRIIDILLFLEKTFGNLDEYYIDTTIYTEDEVKNINQKIYYIIYNNSVNIGDNNKFKDSNIK